jgi:hypothetical protein
MILDDFQLRREDWVSWLRCRAAMSKANGGSVIFLHTLGAGRRASCRAFDRVSLSIIARNKQIESRGRLTEMLCNLALLILISQSYDRA